MSKIDDIISNVYDTTSKFDIQSFTDMRENLFNQNLDMQVPTIETLKIDEIDTFQYQVEEQINQIIERSNEQTELLNEQNKQLINNYKKLEDLYKLKEKELEEAKQEAKKAKRYNTIMMIISVASMMIAVAAWLLPNILGGVS